MASSGESLPARAAARPWNLPGGARLVIGFEFCERVGFYSMVSLLALFLAAGRSAGGFGWDRSSALSTLGVYSGLMYALPVVGGWIADRLFGHRRALALGGSMMLASYALLTAVVAFAGRASVSAPLGYWSLPAGLAAAMTPSYREATVGFWCAIAGLVAGNALIKSTLVVVLGDSFAGEDERREDAYAYYYAGINLGGLVAGIAAGSIAASFGWAAAFGVSVLAMGAAMVAYALLGRRLLRSHPTPAAAAQRGKERGAVPVGSGTGTRLLILALFAALLLIYSIGSFQLWGTMSFYLEHNVDRHAGAFQIPTQWFTSIESVALILAAPVFAAFWARLARRDREPGTVTKYAIALLLGAAGLLLFALSAWRAAGGIRPGWWLPAVGIFVQATGEVAAWTVTYGLVYRLAPPRAVAAVMGAFYASTLGLGAYLAGWLGTFAERLGNDRYFLTLGAVTAGIALASFAMRAPMRSLAASSGAALEARTS
jgi:POT family proton-dependent oligopeptide transporter